MPDAPLPLEVDCQSVKQRLDAKEPIVLLDCREPAEHNLTRIATARLLPMSELAQRVSELDELRDAELVVVCHHGVRSRQVAAWLRQRGFAKAVSLAGGIDRWSLQIDPSLPRY